MQSLEALQDGEHEKQRRHFLYFLLHQVTVSSNFSALTRQRACQVLISSFRLSKYGILCHCVYLCYISFLIATRQFYFLDYPCFNNFILYFR